MARRPPWDPVQNESAKAYAAFCKYRDLGPVDRSLPRVVSERGGNLTELKRWSTKYGWVERARAWDVYVDQRKREKAVQRILEQSEKIADVGEAFRSIMTLPVRAVLARLEEPGGEARLMEELSEMDIGKLLYLATQSARIIPLIVDIEMKALGIVQEGRGAIYTGGAVEPDEEPDEAERAAKAALVMRRHGLLPAPPKP